MQRSIKDIFLNHPVEEKHEDLYKVKKIPYKKDDMYLLEKLMKEKLKNNNVHGSFSKYPKTASSYSGGWGNEKDQRVAFKMSYNNSRQIHKNFLNTYMPQENKINVIDKPILFGFSEDEYNEHLDDMHFKCMISPENQEVDLQLLSREFIKRIETLTGYKLYWRGCIHNDTGHRHAHLCINGKDASGKNVRFPKEMVKTTMRETLSYVTTLMVGERGEREIEAAKKGEISSKRWTKLDERIETYGEKISFNNLPPELMNRLAFLSELKLAEKHEKYFTLKHDWKDTLVTTGRYNTFLEEWQKSEGNLELYSGGFVKGICENVITFDKDEAWNDAVIIKNGNKRIYVPIWQLTKENLVGKEITINGGTRALSRQIRSSDIHIVNNHKRNEKEI